MLPPRQPGRRNRDMLGNLLVLIACMALEGCALNVRGEAEPFTLPVWPAVANVSWPERPSGSEREAFLRLSRGFHVSESCGSFPELSASIARFHQVLRPRRLKPSALPGGDNAGLELLTVCVAGGAAAPLAASSDESYELDILEALAGDGWRATLRAETQLGAYRGLETFAQLVELDPTRGEYGIRDVAPVEIRDAPRFAHRGLMLDCVRHYLPMASIYRTLDGMAAAKLNVFHWHLTDSESLPAESRARPEMWRAAWSPGEVYSAEDVEDVIAYAGARGIRVMPEVGTPGHSRAWALVFPDIFPADGCPTKWWAMDPSKNETYVLLADVLEDFAGRFSDEFFHLGGDEIGVSVWGDVRFDCWEEQLDEGWLNKNGIRSYQGALGHFFARSVAMIEKAGKRPVLWDEAWRNVKDLPRSVVVQVWEDPKLAAEAVADGYDVLFSPVGGWYLDEIDTTWQRMYVLDPLGEVSPASPGTILGGEAAMWTEKVDASTLDSVIWPRAAAVAERLWVGSPSKALRDKPSEIPATTVARLARFRCRVLLERGIGASPLAGVGRAGVDGPSGCAGSRWTELEAGRRSTLPKARRKRKKASGKREGAASGYEL